MENEKRKQTPVFYNTMTKRNEVFVPRQAGVVKLFTCGPSVYQQQHLGNYRTYLFEDVLHKYLEYLGYRVERAINFTDLEDKAIKRLKKEGLTLEETTGPNKAEFLKTSKELGIFLPDEIPQATGSVEEAVQIIEDLLEKGIAYWHKGNVYFDPLKYPRFGEVFGLDMTQWPEKRVRFSRDTYNGTRWNLGDFILWHGTSSEDPVSWDSRIGKGRPAWNVQDPAMILKTLGPEIDIHTGGIDNVYRHHDYNRAILESYSGKKLAHYWLHGEHLIVEGAKMSKSKGNTMYPKDAYAHGCSPQQVRFMLMCTYYRHKLNVSAERIDECCRHFSTIRQTLEAIQSGSPREHNPTAPARVHKTYRPGSEHSVEKLIDEVPILFSTKMNDDMDTPGAIESIEHVADEFYSAQQKSLVNNSQRQRFISELKSIDRVLGFLF
ncbi:MAG: class I tRNA ligase family protein [Spirochaetia bacterium]|nr:class I tRNA ligase family protein [Spirochaetia bacterium]